MNYIKEKLALDKIPHFTTLQKFVTRVPSSLFNFLLSRILKLFYSYGENVSVAAIDATGFTSSYASYYYSRRTGKLRRSFLRTSISIDTSKKVILGWKISQKTDHEIKHANALIRQSNRMRKSDCYVMDKGYDSEKIHSIIREKNQSRFNYTCKREKKEGNKWKI